ncbi:MAG: bifunctional diaminohydroxyphosphoribosylaminopyrimidine deaminase/5-amino-6-(5-phosphoribosylamino)uracil reductase RibD [Rubricella sp.]
MADDTDLRHMRHALGLARRGLGTVWPNPAVGCVIVRDRRVVGRGSTRPGGRPHAEAVALAEAGEAARQATAYVTLEPCSHHGRSPPCADALIDAGIARVVCPLEDPDPRVEGRGFARLRAAGIVVDRCDPLVEEAVELNAGFLMHRTAGRPLVTLKIAVSIDGRIATGRGESRWITGPAARERVHLIRARHDAILIGAGTARADDPMLDVRLPGFPEDRPVRVVADGSLSLSLTGRLARTARRQPVWLFHRRDVDRARRDAWHGLGAETIVTGTTREGALDPVAMLEALAKRGITRVLCEGGGQLAAALLRDDLVDRIVEMRAGLTLGSEGRPALGPLGIERLANAPRFRLAAVAAVGPDTMATWLRDPQRHSRA